jgi:uncharacterized phage-associated protein
MAINFKMNTQKAVECVLWFIQRGGTDCYNMYNIWKMLYAAEKYHLNKYGRPITGDNYYAMKHGTVPSKLYDIAKDSLHGIGFCKREDNYLIAERDPEDGYFADSDMEALEYGYNEYSGLAFAEVEAKNHEELAWKKNYKQNGSTLIPFEDIIEQDWVLEDLEGVAQYMVL